jgi:hypothetical protein
MRGRRARYSVAGLLSVVLTFVLSIPPVGAADRAASHLGAPTGVVVTPTVGGIRVSWNLDPQTGVT